jgi:DNA polymerase-3 subunit gamma/tau
MTYLVLARKYRPRTFGDVVGQEIVTATLRGAIQEHRVGHAYLFTGPRGTGKTTTARILAKALNCERAPTLDPCLQCERCIAADSGAEVDIVEIDAASNTGVDSVRELRDSAAFLPLKARHKIYIIDEVHMLSKPAFNALLKTLEEPPPHVKFLLATTDLHKVLETVVSRCQVLRLSPLPEKIIRERLDEIFSRESIRAEAGVSAEIARRARGGMRDALSIADQLLALSGLEPKLENLRALASEAGSEVFETVLDAIEAHSAAAALAALPATQGGEAEWLALFLSHLRGNLLIALCGENFPLVELGPSEKQRAIARAQRVGAEKLGIWLEELLMARERMQPLPQHARSLLEVALIDLCRPETSLGLEELIRRLEALEARLGSAPAVARPTAPPAPAASSSMAAALAAPTPTGPAPAATAQTPTAQSPTAQTPTAQTPAAPAPTALSAPLTDPKQLWPRLLEELGTHSASLQLMLRQRGRLAELSGGVAKIQLTNPAPEERALLDNPRTHKLLQALLTRLLGRDCQAQFDEPSRAPVRKEQDRFTGEVSQLFGGRIEDDR